MRIFLQIVYKFWRFGWVFVIWVKIDILTFIVSIFIMCVKLYKLSGTQPNKTMFSVTQNLNFIHLCQSCPALAGMPVFHIWSHTHTTLEWALVSYRVFMVFHTRRNEISDRNPFHTHSSHGNRCIYCHGNEQLFRHISMPGVMFHYGIHYCI